ncbi:MAG: hypothetical protein Q9192_003858, partial [Flavoplaca navasiana]
TMGVLSKILPDPAFKYLQKAIKPPKPRQEKSLQYSDTLVILKVPRDGSEPAFQSLKEFASSIHLKTVEYQDPHHVSSIGFMLTSHAINLAETLDSLRFNSNLNAVNLQVDGLLFREWLEQGEARGLWTCDL